MSTAVILAIACSTISSFAAYHIGKFVGRWQVFTQPYKPINERWWWPW